MTDQLGDPLADELPNQPREVDWVVGRALADRPALDEYAFQESIFSVLDEVEDAIRWEVAC